MHDRLNDGGAPARPRLLVISPWENVWSLADAGGVKAGVSDDDRFIDGFTRAGYELHFLRPQGPHDDPRVVTHTYPNFFRSTAGYPTAARRLLWPSLFNINVVPRALSLARSLAPVVVMGHSHYSTPATWWCRRVTGIPSVVKLFGVMDLVHTEWSATRYYAKNIEQLAALKYPQDAWIVLDDGTRGGDILRARGLPSERVHFLPNGMDLEWMDRKEDRAQARARFKLPLDAKVVLFLARLVDSKRPQDAIAAFARVAGISPGAHLVVAGDGHLRGACERAVNEAALSGRVSFAGVLPHDDIPVLMAACDVFVSTSTLTNRALPTCEAMMCGVPVVVYDTGDTATVVRHNESGLLAHDGDVDALARGIEQLFADAELRTRLAEGARAVARGFSPWSKRIAMELAIIQALAQRKRATG
ncbi:MAG TPA: glycosyltransferase family 4 protein [Candidatus Krumholzibacteria bacterium]|nr:glycosyltransferase family 4 protein [Candidatus Krumholzibacteria bacterium]